MPFNSEAYKVLEGGADYKIFAVSFVALAIALAMLFVSYRSSVVVCRALAASLTA